MVQLQSKLVVILAIIVLSACSNPSSDADSTNLAANDGSGAESSQNLQDNSAGGSSEGSDSSGTTDNGSTGDSTSNSGDSAVDTSGGATATSDSSSDSTVSGIHTYQSLDNTYSYRLDSNPDSDNWLVFVHGGNWFGGNKNDPLFYGIRGRQANTLLAKFNVASLEYQLWDPELGTGTHYDQTTNIVDFLRTVKTPGNKVCLMGHSAGAHLAASVVTRFPELVDCFIGVAGVYDMSVDGMQYDHPGVQEQELQYMEQSSIEVSPAAMLTSSYDIPTLIIHSKNDPVVGYQHAVNFAEQIDQDTQAEVTLVLDDKLIPLAAHNIMYFAGTNFLYPDRKALLRFIDSQLVE